MAMTFMAERSDATIEIAGVFWARWLVRLNWDEYGVGGARLFQLALRHGEVLHMLVG